MSFTTEIASPIPFGSGAHVVHKQLEAYIPGYQVYSYNPYLTLFPPALKLISRKIDSRIIHTTPDYGWMFHKENIPLILTFHGFVLDRYMKEYSSTLQYVHYMTDLKYLTLKALEKATVVTAVSRYLANLVKSELGYHDEIRVIHNGIDTELFVPGRKSDSSPIKVLYVGNLRKAKGVGLLPSIADKLNDGIIIQYTTGLRDKNLIFNSSKLVNVGSVPYDKMPALYNQADILLFPTAREGFGLAAAEAMASELPVVASDCSALPEILINGKGGYLCDPKRADEFAHRLNQLADSPQLRREMGQFNRLRIEQHFSLRKMLLGYADLFSEVGSG